ncbi:uncharacterized protein LOC112569351 isoform X3 [Pomacea canaliculata]|uniref:uncharacterized protein LOC112569351 isoform X2 n=1 Tax=Pomacea canaliculata TaxID=400727 RepID=UPI000D7304ED|nr:uncharacterized protein LOC112569351 isoform X2 [Pomacea canaliculata]XP_025102928.1 uncharacterized protein LOC112569351 isoform X2 [Pomacea canaliculata]XP_025102929.1 uncharacterized protein LOC112569351 isoform X3 [Pomacea canaliculata]
MKIIILLCLLTAVLGYSYNNTMIEEDFRAMDTNADGSITNDERENKFRRMDVNGDSKVSFVEFHKRLRPGISLAVSYAAFNIYDQQSGHKDNFYDFWDSQATFNLVDLDHDNKLTLEEYKRHVKQIIERSRNDSGVTA